MKPGGNVSRKRTSDRATRLGFVNPRVKRALSPGLSKTLSTVFVTLRSTAVMLMIFTASVDVLFVNIGSPSPATVAWLVSASGALDATETTAVTDGYWSPAATASDREHVMVCPATRQSQPAPEAPVGVRPAGTSLARVTAPRAAPLPTFDTSIEKVACCCPRRKSPVCIIVIFRSGFNCVIDAVSEAVLLSVRTSPPPLTWAVVTITAGAVLEMFASRVIAG